MIIYILLILFKGIIGYLGAKRKNRSLLSLYLSLIVSILVLEQVAIYFAISFQSRIKKDIHESVKITVDNYKNSEGIENKISENALENIQNMFSCCGAEGPSDFKNNSMPISCYQDHDLSQKPFSTGCSSTIYEYIIERIPFITKVLFLIIIFEIVAIVASIIVCNRPQQIESYDLF